MTTTPLLPTGSTVEKDPAATEWAKGIDWTDYCAERSTTITVSQWFVSPPNELIVHSSSIVSGSVQTQVKLSNGKSGTKYRVINTITTAAGGVDRRSFFVNVKER